MGEWLTSPWFWPAVAAGGAAVIALAALLLLSPVYKHIVCLKYLFGGWKAVVPIVSALPAALGVFLLILVFAIMDGFVNETREMTRGTLADIIVDAHLGGMPYYDEFADRIERIEGVEVATPVIQSYVVVRVKPSGEYRYVKPIVRPCLLLGIRPAEKAKMGRFLNYLGRKVPPDAPPQALEHLLDVPTEYQKAGQPPRPGVIAGTAVIGVPVTDYVPETVQVGAGRRVLAVFLAIIAAVALLFVWVAARRRLEGPGRFLCAAIVWWVWLPMLWLGLTLFEFGLWRYVLPWLGSGIAARVFVNLLGVGLLLLAVVLSVIAAWRFLTNVLSKPVTRSKGLKVLASPLLVGLTLVSNLGAVLLWIVGALVYLVWCCLQRKGGKRIGWLAATVLCAIGVVGFSVVFFMPIRQVTVMREEVVDYPLLGRGDDLVVSTIPVRPSGAIETEPGGIPKVSSRVFALVDVFRSKYWEADSSHLYVDFGVAQQMAGMEGSPAEGVPARASQIQVKIRDPAAAGTVVNRIQKAWEAFQAERPDEDLPQVTVNTWETQQRMILTVVEVERNITTLMLGLMFVGFAVLIALISYVMAYIKSRDVGILKAVGASDAGVGSLFLGYGFLIGLLGTALGMIGALLMLHYLDPIEIWVNQTLNVDIFPREMYYFDHIPRHLSPWWCVGVSGAVLSLATLASMVGGLLAAIRQPVETLRYE